MTNFTRRRVARRVAISVVGLLAVASFAVAAPPVERGFPVIAVFPAEVHRAGPQNFDMAQDSRGILYFGNLHGLVTYDGAWWRLKKLPDDQVALSVATHSDGRIAVGMVNDFGHLAADSSGADEYRSLLPLVPKAKQNFGDVRSICTMESGFAFVAERSLMIWDGPTIRILAEYEPVDAPRECLAQGSWLLLSGPKGVQRLDPRSGTIEPAGLDKRVTMLVELEGLRAIAAVRDEGLYLVEGNRAQPFAPQASEWLKGKTTVGGARLDDGRIVIATQQHGLLLLLTDGSVEQVIGADAGLPDAIINDAMVDREGALWLAMEGPIVRIDLTSPVSVFDVRRGLRGSAGDVTRYAGRIYSATTHGLFVIDEQGNAKRIEGIREGAWRLLSLDDELLVGSSKGVYRIDARGVLDHVVELEEEVYDLVRSQEDPSRVWIAQGDGLASMRRTSEGWRHEGVVAGVPRDISSIVESDGVLWTGSVFNGILRIEDARSPKPRVRQFDKGEMNVYRVSGRPVFVRATGEVLALGQGGTLIPDPVLGHIRAPRGFFILLEDQGAIWINSTPPRVFTPKSGGRYAREGMPLVSVTAADIQNVRSTDQGVIWFASDKGLFRFKHVDTKSDVAQPAPLVRRVIAGENHVLYAGTPGRNAPVELKHRFGRIRIEYAPASYRPGVSYQYRLEPVDRDWSEWIDQPFIDYTSLAPADYTFHVRSRGAAAVPSQSAHWSFSVLPPWYRTAWAWILWVALALALIVGVIRLRTGSLRRQAATLKTKVAEQTAELQETVRLLGEANVRLEAMTLEDDLTRIANRRFFERSLTDEWNRARRHNTPLALILLDLDHFKELNDRRGHPAGDDCLRRIGAFLAHAIRRSGEVVARYGGEEFAILLPGAEIEPALRVAEGLREGIELLAIPYANPPARRVTASCGVASMTPSSEAGPENLVAGADRALYAAKHSGRNCVRGSDETTTGTWLRDASA